MNQESKNERLPWYAWVFIILAMVLGLCLVVPRFSPSPEHGNQAKFLSNGKQVVIAMKIYAEDHQGSYPTEMIDLEKHEVLAHGTLARLLSLPPQYDSSGVGWTYFRGLNKNTPPDHPVLVSPVFSNNAGKFMGWLRVRLGMPLLESAIPKRFVACSGGSISVMKETDFQKHLKDHHVTFPPPMPVAAN
jgi:hypothetical protein